MATVVPVRMIGVPLWSQIVGPDGRPLDVGPWTALTADHHASPCRRIIGGVECATDPNATVALIVPELRDAIMNLLDGGFQIMEARSQ